MQDKEKIKIVQFLIKEIGTENILCEDEINGVYYDYDTVIELLEKAKNIMITTERCPRPKNIPNDIPWCENMNPEVEFDPFVYHGDMTPEDFRKAQNDYLNDKYSK